MFFQFSREGRIGGICFGSHTKFYMTFPVCSDPKDFQKIKDYAQEMILVALFRPRSSWFPMWKSMAISSLYIVSQFRLPVRNCYCQSPVYSCQFGNWKVRFTVEWNGIPPNLAEVTQRSWKSSLCQSYVRHWKSFQIWCDNHYISALECRCPSLMQFLW